MSTRLKLEKQKSPVAFPIGATVSAGGVWLASIDRPFASAPGPWVLSFSSDLVGWRECLRHPSPRSLLRAFGGVVVRGWPEVTDARCSSNGQTWTELLLPTADVRLFEDGRDGLWAFEGDQLWHRVAGTSAFERVGLVVDGRRSRLFSLGSALAVAASNPAPISAEFVEAEALLASMEAPLLAARTGTLGSLRTQAERTEPRGGWQPHLVYLDALQDAGDPDAPILATLNRLQQGPRFDDYLIANFAQIVSPAVLTRRDALTWRNGFIDSATVYGSQVRGLLERTSAHLLRRLHVRGHHDPFDLSAIGQTLRGLHVLDLDGFFWSDEDDFEHHDWGDLSPLWRALGQLRTLWITGAIDRLGVVVLPSCEQLTLVFERAPADDLAALRVPSVRGLKLAWNGGGSLGWLSTLLARTMASLNVVRIAGRNGDDVADVLSTSKLPLSCETLELTGVQLTDAGLERLASVKWPRLRTLDLRWNRLSVAGIERARSLCSEVMLAEQAPTTEFTWPPNWLL